MPKTPRLSGAALRAVELATRPLPVRAAVAKLLRDDLGVTAALALSEDARGPMPTSMRPTPARRDHALPAEDRGALPLRPWPRSIAALAAAFRERRTRASDVARAALDAARTLASRSPTMGPMLGFDDERALRAAADSDDRWQRGAPLGPLDGIPIVIKEEIAVAGFPTRLGSNALPAEGAPRDGTIVARLRQAGAVVLGTTPMTEFGLSPIGVNPHRKMPRNPHDERRVAGGSSTGSGVAVSTGLVPVALGADGGGSIRTPACLTGVFGLKPTFGRLSRTGGGLANSVSVFGPIGGSTVDLAAFLAACAGEDPEDDLTLGQPALDQTALDRALRAGVRGLRIGIEESEWQAAPPDVAGPGRDALAALEREGAVLVPVRLDLARHTPAIGYLTIGLEELALLRSIRLAHSEQLSLDLRMSMRALGQFGADEYIDGQRLRAGVRREVASVLRQVDVLALPTVGCTAPLVNDQEARDGFVDPQALEALCRFAFLANLAGLPAGSAPVGRGADGLPVGLQILGDAWDEASVLAVLAHLERTEVARVVRPRVSVDLY